MRPCLLACFALLPMLLASCATPQSRIERDPATYAALTPEQQERVKAGRVGVGFDAAAVRLAIGEPDRIVERESSEGLTQVWVYLDVVPGFYNGSYCTPGFPYYGYPNFCRQIAPTQYEEHMRVSFKDGKVVSVERAR